MATSLENLQTALSNVEARIIELTAGLNPDYGLDGQSESLASYLATLTKARDDLRKQLIAEEGHADVRVQGVPW